MIITSDAVNTSDDRAVAEVLHEVYAAWASGDADAFVTPYTEHATAVLPGSYLQGKDTIRSTMAAGFAGWPDELTVLVRAPGAPLRPGEHVQPASSCQLVAEHRMHVASSVHDGSGNLVAPGLVSESRCMP